MIRPADPYSPVSPFGAMLKRFRTSQDYTQRELAARAGLSRITINRLELGRRRSPTNGVLQRLVDALDIRGSQAAAFSDAARLSKSRPISLDDPVYELTHGALWFGVTNAVFRRAYRARPDNYPAPLIDERKCVRWERQSWIDRFGEPDLRRLTPRYAKMFQSRQLTRKRSAERRKK
jgi:Predicted transcriptional regulators